jgi:hypothetical protein
MVPNPRATLRPGPCKPVNVPEPVIVEENCSGIPTAVKLARRKQAVTAIENRWRIDDEWWRDAPVSRFYYTVLIASGQRLVLYKDLENRNWYQQIY